MATNLELRLLRLERQQSERARQLSAPALDVYYLSVDDDGQLTGEVFAYSVLPQPRIAATFAL